ncbi:DndE family protein [Melittangium boletus]|uniref:DndE family protein n=1 Tax=Melittangium boletus TaxID=83453 RepID=UPI003DA51F1C
MSQGKTWSLVEAHAATYSTSVSADTLNSEFMSRLGVKSRNYVARLALARSLSLPEQPPQLEGSAGSGKTIHGKAMFGDDYQLWLGFLVEHAGSPIETVAELQESVRRHWARGIALLEKDWRHANGEFEDFLRLLADRAGIQAESRQRIPGQTSGASTRTFVPRACPVRVPVGEVAVELTTRKRVEWLLNGSGGAPHFAIMGETGSGKTRTGMSMLRSIRDQAGCPVILFDMTKGELAGDANLVRELDATVVDPSRAPIPLDVLHLPTGEDVFGAAMRFRESFSRVPVNRIGAAQADALRDAAERALTRHQPTRVADVRDRLKEVYAEKRRKDDIVTATFNDMTGRTLFEPQLSPAEFFSRSWILDLHSLNNVQQRLVVFLLVDALYTYLRLLPESTMDAGGHRALRVVLAIDEAHKVLGEYQPASLTSLVRESRSKGGWSP